MSNKWAKVVVTIAIITFMASPVIAMIPSQAADYSAMTSSALDTDFVGNVYFSDSQRNHEIKGRMNFDEFNQADDATQDFDSVVDSDHNYISHTTMDALSLTRSITTKTLQGIGVEEFQSLV
ncbi:hypothetical protein [Alloscardovia criceti]|uniref:hypothetical protein n=1 Tax=Alloscardovia criceti TaxID=356828 RepID=UPI000379A446|nr:hypothetical protein [Alloscardovia criceti]